MMTVLLLEEPLVSSSKAFLSLFTYVILQGIMWLRRVPLNALNYYRVYLALPIASLQSKLALEDCKLLLEGLSWEGKLPNVH